MSTRVLGSEIKIQYSCDHEDCRGIGTHRTFYGKDKHDVEKQAEKARWKEVGFGPGDKTTDWCPKHWKKCPTCKGKKPKPVECDCCDHCQPCHHQPDKCEECRGMLWVEVLKRETIVKKRLEHEGRCWTKRFSKEDPECWEVELRGIFTCKLCRAMLTDDIGLDEVG